MTRLICFVLILIIHLVNSQHSCVQSDGDGCEDDWCYGALFSNCSIPNKGSRGCSSRGTGDWYIEPTCSEKDNCATRTVINFNRDNYKYKAHVCCCKGENCNSDSKFLPFGWCDDCEKKRKEILKTPMILVLVLPLTLSLLMLGAVLLLAYLVLIDEKKRMEQVQISAFQMMDAVLTALCPKQVIECIGCAIDNTS